MQCLMCKKELNLLDKSNINIKITDRDSTSKVYTLCKDCGKKVSDLIEGNKPSMEIK